MQALIVILLVVLIGAVVFIGMRLSGASPTAEPAAAPAIDPTVIAQAVKTAIDVNAIATGVKGAVETQMLQTAQQALAQNNAQAAQQAQQTLAGQTQALEQQARILLQPFEERIKQLTKSVGDLQSTYTAEQSAVQSLLGQVNILQSTTTTLTNSLKSPTARGNWGENQLRNIMQLAGMEPYCDYSEQFTDGVGDSNQRPDAVVSLSTGGRIAIDSKTPLAAYIRMQEATDLATKEAELKQHAKDLRNHVKTLADKKYWLQFGQNAPDFVVMFIPGEGFVSDAMRVDTTLMEDAMKQRVLIASPMNLMALLLTVNKGWESHKLAEHAEQVAKLGAEMYERVGTVLGAVEKVGKNLGTANTAYNEMVASFEGRLLVTMRKLNELGVVKGDSREIKGIETTPRPITAPEKDQLPGAPGELPPAD